jgi:hypothetical protein
MSDADLRDRLDDLAREIDMLVWRLEQPPAAVESVARREREQLRRELESVRDRLADMGRAR